MVSFELKDGSPGAVDRFLLALRWFTLGESLGGVESLVAHPATMTHASMTPEARREAGIGDGLVRLSVGLEDQVELVHDLAQALAASARGNDPASEPAFLKAADPYAGGLP